MADLGKVFVELKLSKEAEELLDRLRYAMHPDDTDRDSYHIRPTQSYEVHGMNGEQKFWHCYGCGCGWESKEAFKDHFPCAGTERMQEVSASAITLEAARNALPQGELRSAYNDAIDRLNVLFSKLSK